jgi:c-di-GMP-binding flagellar brake protein YcgR
LRKSFQVQLAKVGLESSFEGTSVDLSQGGAFIKIEKWRSFRAKDPAEIAFLLPPEFTGQERIIRLQGKAVIKRVDQKNKGIGVEFTKTLKQFEPVVLSKAVNG